LAATSSVFKSALKLGTQSNECIITVPGIALHLLKIVVCFAYTGEIMIPKENLTEEYLSTVISVLEQLGFTLSAVIARYYTASNLLLFDCRLNHSNI
jgi:BTB/POZ domain